MFTPAQFRAKAAEYTELIKTAPSREAAKQYVELEQSFTTLANNEQWLSDNYDQTIHSPARSPADGGEKAAPTKLENMSLAIEEEQILRYLGAALIMQWSTLPRKLQRELFDVAGSMGELLETAPLRGQIARFLHKHKTDER